MRRWGFAIAFVVFAGCADRPLWLPGTGPGANANGNGNGNAKGNGNANGNGNGNGNGDGGAAAPVPRLVRPSSTASVSSRRPRLSWDMTGVDGAATVQLCADRDCTKSLGSATVDASGASAVPDQDLPSGPVFWRVGAPAGASATWELFVGKKSAPRDAAWGSTLDLDGDGRPDAAFGVQGGNVLVYLSSQGGPSATPLVIASPDGAKVGFGYALASAGDVNGDGFADLAVGECAKGVGTVHVYFGAPGGPDPAAAQAIASPDQLEGFGCRLAGAGDLDGDGYAELAVARIGADFSGGLYLFRGGAGGPASTTTRIDSPAKRLGYSLAGVGDVDGDDFDDLVATEIDKDDLSGRAFVFAGGPDLTNLSVRSLASPDPRGQQYGASVALAGDVDGDGWPDFVVGAPAAPTVQLPSRAHLYHGGPVGLDGSVELRADGTPGFAHEVGGGRDVDGDGFDDVVVGATDSLVLFRGGTLVPSSGQTITAAGQGLNPRHFGVAGDLDGDGLADMIVVDGAGASVLFGGGVDGLGRTQAFTLPSGLSNLGGAVARLHRLRRNTVGLVWARGRAT